MYTNTMKKRTKPLNKANEARRKAEAEALFSVMLKSKHTVATPTPKKGTRSVRNRKAIQEF